MKWHMYRCTHMFTYMKSEDCGQESTWGTSKVRTSTGNRNWFLEEKASLVTWNQESIIFFFLQGLFS